MSGERYPNCAKEREHGEEWNIIAMFFEWLSEKGISLCRYETDEEARARGGTIDGKFWVWEYPLPLGRNLLSLFHEYIDVDEAELERERRRLLDEVEKKQRE